MAIDSSSVAAAAPRPAPPSVTFHENEWNREAPAVAEADMSFWDFLDIINPLHHIPLVGTAYRAVTGDEISSPARVMGGILFGGAIGGLTAVANAVVDESTGKDIGEHALVAMGMQSDKAPATAVAAAPAPPSRDSSPVPGPAAPTLAAPTLAALASPAAAPAAPTRLNDPFTAKAGEHRPTKMPTRDTILANTTQVARPAAGKPPQTAVPAIPQAGPAPAPEAAIPPGSPSGSKEALSDVMLRNLDKYEQARRAAQRPPSSVRVSG